MNVSKKAYFPKKVPSIIKRINFKSGLSFLLDNDELINVEKSLGQHIFGIAIDLGTTSISVSLCDLESSQELAQAVIRNKQYIYALNMIAALPSLKNPRKNKPVLSAEIIASINKVLKKCLQKSGVKQNRIFTAVVVGNPLMLGLILEPLGEAGIIKKQKNQLRKNYLVKSKYLGLNINDQANVRFLQGVDNTIGSDAIAAVLKIGLLKSKAHILCIDLGVDSKIIIGNNRKISVVCSNTSSSFEGHLLKCGMIAKPGAIEWVRIDKGEIKILTVGHIRPLGICGSGVIDTISELLKNKMINSQGHLKNDSFVVYQDKSSCVELTNDDIKKIQVSKAIISAGIKILMKNLNIGFDQIEKVFISGELGSYLNTAHIYRLGMIPLELKNKIDFGGNVSFLGAKMVLLNRKNLKKIQKIQKIITHVDLKHDEQYINLYKKALNFNNSQEG